MNELMKAGGRESVMVKRRSAGTAMRRTRVRKRQRCLLDYGFWVIPEDIACAIFIGSEHSEDTAHWRRACHRREEARAEYEISMRMRAIALPPSRDMPRIYHAFIGHEGSRGAPSKKKVSSDG